MVTPVTARRTTEAFARRCGPANALAGEAEAIARACHAMARRFHRGGRLIVVGAGGSASDAAHVVVEFVHPVIVGKRALPAFALDGPDPAARLALLAEPDDILLGLSVTAGAELAGVLRTARAVGLLTVALVARDGTEPGPEADHVLLARTTDPLVAKEVQVTTYHVLWELVHVFAERPEALS